MRIFPIKKLNKETSIDAPAVVCAEEQRYQELICEVADAIRANAAEKPIVLLSGPSGSGKTTSAIRLAALLKESGHKAHVISLDNYFLPIGKGDGTADLSKVDLESPERLDMRLLSDHLRKFWQCEPVEIPVFDFSKQARRSGGTLCRKPSELIILEGIHALNPEVTIGMEAHSSRVYVSVRTRLALEKRLLHPSKIRLMRRLMRDNLFRGRKTEDIIRSFESVQRGEQLYIMPYKDMSEYSIDTFLSYEAAVYRSLLLPRLREIDPDFELYNLVEDISVFLEKTDPLPIDIVPLHSLIREFIGGSALNY